MNLRLIARSCVRQLKFRGLQYFLYGSIISIPLFIVAVFYDLGKSAVFLAIVAGFGLAFLVYFFHIMCFGHVIRRQERRFGIPFSDEESKYLWKNSPVSVTEDWFILGGAAFYRGYIKDITWEYMRLHYGRGVGRYYLIVKTIDSRLYRLPLDSKSGCAKVRRWWKTERIEEFYGL